jgi:hypothetical protein
MGGIEVQGEGRQAAEPGKRARRLWTAEEKRRIVRESQRPGAVRQEVAQRHGVHVSVMNRWRTEQPSGASPAKKTVKPVRLPLLCPRGACNTVLVFLTDPDVPIDTNHLERALRVIPMGRKYAGRSSGQSRSA